MSPSEHAVQVHTLLRTFEHALHSRIADINAAAIATGPDALAGRVITQIFEDGIGVIGHFAGQIEANLAALGIEAVGALPTVSPPTAPVPSEPSIAALQGAKLLMIEVKRLELLGSYTPAERDSWRAYPARVYAAAAGTGPALTPDEQAEFRNLSRIDLIEGHAGLLRDRCNAASSPMELDQIPIEEGWP